MMARAQFTITRDDTELSLMLQRMPPTFKAFMNMELPTLPWKKVATDLFYWKASTYLLIVDYFSTRYIEINKLNGQSSSEIISDKINLC